MQISKEIFDKCFELMSKQKLMTHHVRKHLDEIEDTISAIVTAYLNMQEDDFGFEDEKEGVN